MHNLVARAIIGIVTASHDNPLSLPNKLRQRGGASPGLWEGEKQVIFQGDSIDFLSSGNMLFNMTVIDATNTATRDSRAELVGGLAAGVVVTGGG